MSKSDANAIPKVGLAYPLRDKRKGDYDPHPLSTAGYRPFCYR